MTNHTTDTVLRRHQMVMLELLRELDAVCRRHDITYTLFAGTLLGAVREGGFIPWDDDLDVIFPRKDYERFLDAAERELDPERFFVQREFSEHWPMHSSKLRRNGTTCLEKYYPKDPEMHRGIYIDLFPSDALSDSPLIARLQFYASKIVIAKALDARGYVTRSPIKKLALVLSRLLPREPFLRLVRFGDRTDTNLVHSFFGGCKRFEKNVYPRDWFTRRICVPFEDGKYPISAAYDDLLTCLYGDWRTPLPEEKRDVKQHTFLVDPDRSYLDYLSAYDGVTFDILTQSIR